MDATYGGLSDAFVAKINAAGSALVYSTLLGGSNQDIGTSVAVDTGGNAYVTGFTASTDFPTTPGAFDTTCGADGACTGGHDAFVAKLNPTGSGLVFSTYLGGNGDDKGNGIVADGLGNAYVVGATASAEFPSTPVAIDTTQNGGWDVFIAKMNPLGMTLVYSTLAGGAFVDLGKAIAIDAAGNAYVTGQTNSADFPTTPGVFDPAFTGHSTDAFVTKINPTGSALVYSSYLGGGALDSGSGIAIDLSGNAYVTGATSSTDFPVVAGSFDTTCGTDGACNATADAFVTKVNATATMLAYSTFLGGGTPAAPGTRTCHRFSTA